MGLLQRLNHARSLALSIRLRANSPTSCTERFALKFVCTRKKACDENVGLLSMVFFSSSPLSQWSSLVSYKYRYRTLMKCSVWKYNHRVRGRLSSFTVVPTSTSTPTGQPEPCIRFVCHRNVRSWLSVWGTVWGNDVGRKRTRDVPLPNLIYCRMFLR